MNTVNPQPRSGAIAAQGRRFGRRLGATLATLALSELAVLFIWQVVGEAGSGSAVVRTPYHVWQYLGTAPGAGSRRSAIMALLAVTLGHAIVGFVVGVGGSTLAALACVLFRPLELMFTTVAMLMRTVPLLAMAPLIELVVGNGIAAAASIGGIVVFFPVLANVSLGLRSTSVDVVDLIRSQGGSRLVILTKVAVPTALSHLLAGARIAVPGAMSAAMLYEWLFTFSGLGGAVTRAKTESDYDLVWVIVALVTSTPIALYVVATLIETTVLERRESG